MSSEKQKKEKRKQDRGIETQAYELGQSNCSHARECNTARAVPKANQRQVERKTQAG